MPVASQVKRRRGTAEENNAFTGAEGEITVDLTNKTLRVHDGETLGGTAVETQRNKSTTITAESTDDQYPSAKAVVDYVSTNSGGAMPVGAIFTTPRTGTIEGAVEANGGSYNLADYSGEGSIGALLTAGKITYVSKTEFQTRVANTGACDSFGWEGSTDALYAWSRSGSSTPTTVYTKTSTPTAADNLYDENGQMVEYSISSVGTNYDSITVEIRDAVVFDRDSAKDIAGTPDPTFLVPKLNPWHVGKSAPVVGNGGAVGIQVANSQGVNQILTTNIAGGDLASGITYGSATTPVGITIDPTKSGVIADLSETTNLRVMVQLATGTTDEALETCTSVLADVSALKYDYVVDFQAPTAANGYTWYRKYKSGWVEQGGRYTNRQNILTTMPVAMSDTNYSVVLTYETDSANNTQYASLSISTNKTTTSFTIKNAGSIYGGWQVSGMAAQ